MSYDQQRLLAGHLLRRIGFGPNAQEVSAVLSQGWDAYINSQLNPATIDDSAAEAKFAPVPTEPSDLFAYQRRWYSRMFYSRRVLKEKMTLILHEHFATSLVKIGLIVYMVDQEEFFRANALGSFRDLLIGISKDKAMLVWLDNNNNSGTFKDSSGNLIPPSQNYARELLQLFSLGTTKLDRYGNILRDSAGNPVPAYTETDVAEVSRALTGWYIEGSTTNLTNTVKFDPNLHDSGNKVIFGQTLIGQTGSAGQNELTSVIDLIMRQSTHSRFIAKILIQKLATETPSPSYIDYVGQVYSRNSFNLKYTIQAILTYPDFTSDALVRTQYKNPIEQFVGALRGLNATLATNNNVLVEWTTKAAQRIYFPPSVFSFYPPGRKINLVNTALVTYRDQAANAFVVDSSLINFSALLSANKLTTPELVVDYLSDALLTAPLDSSVRSRILTYMNGSISVSKVKGAAWLLLCSPDFQRN
jgi:uncharacterized protein (DUF1800 family)